MQDPDQSYQPVSFFHTPITAPPRPPEPESLTLFRIQALPGSHLPAFPYSFIRVSGLLTIGQLLDVICKLIGQDRDRLGIGFGGSSNWEPIRHDATLAMVRAAWRRDYHMILEYDIET